MSPSDPTNADVLFARLGARHRTFLAPMEGAGHPTFRAMIAERGGVGVLCTEFVRIHRGDMAPARLSRVVVRAPGHPLSVQVMGNEAEKMAEAAGVIDRAGADVVDINLGCPMPRVVRKGVGAAMLKDPVLLTRVLEAMRASVDGLLSAKIRAGFDDEGDAAERAVAIARTVEAAGVDFIAVHPRRRSDFYRGVADWRIIRELRRALSIPVVGNGDVWYADDVARMREETGCDAVMIGRPALRNPWIFAQAAARERGEAPFEPNGADVCAYVEEAIQRYEPAYGKRALGRLKELIRYLARASPKGGAYTKTALRATDLGALLAATEAHFARLSSAELDLRADGHLGLERRGSALGARDAA